MILQKSFSITICLFLLAAVGFAQTGSQAKTSQIASKQIAPAVRLSPAYAEILLRKTEREAELEEFLLDYTDEFPKVLEIKFELELLQKQTDKFLTVSAADAPKLSLALGKLLVRKTELEVELWGLLKKYNAEHPEVKRAKRKIEIFEKAINEILP